VYNKINFKKIKEIQKYYPKIETFLENIYLDKIYQNIQETSIQILEKLIKNSDINEKNLVIISITPIEMAIL
jgi:hypothetical protein